VYNLKLITRFWLKMNYGTKKSMLK